MEMITFILGIVLRIGIPVGATFLLIWLFHRLDARWQSQAEQGGLASAQSRVANRGCWEINNCSQEGRSQCPAFAHPEMPCWQVFRSGDGTLREKCLGCKVFKEAPSPVPA